MEDLPGMPAPADLRSTRSRAREILARSLGQPPADSNLESTIELGEASAEGGFDKPVPLETRLTRSESWITGFVDQLGGAGEHLYPVRDELIADARRAFHRIEAEGIDAPLDAAAEAGLEAIIETDGSRPVFLVQDNALNSAAIQASSEWHLLMASRTSGIERVAKAVGRVNDPSGSQRFQGSAFAVAPGIVMTNRHVLQAIATQSGSIWTFKSGINIDFAREYGRDRVESLAIRNVLFAGPTAIDPFNIRHELLDIALLQLEDEQATKPWPAPLPIVIRPETCEPPRAVVTCGFPGDPFTDEPADLKLKLFQLIFGYKVMAPGRISRGPAELAHSERKWSIGHDTTTLPGNSGSCIIDIEAGAEVIGLHYAGQPRVMNFGHVLQRVGGEPVPDTGQDLITFLKSRGATIKS
jgi:hypothetical protein